MRKTQNICSPFARALRAISARTDARDLETMRGFMGARKTLKDAQTYSRYRIARELREAQ